MAGKTSILIINWNNAPDTIACIESVLGFQDSQILLIDNASADDSVSVITNHLLKSQIAHSILPLAATDTVRELNGGVIFIISELNLGFAGGNNALLKIAQQWGHKYAWLLNNDAVAAPDALKALVDGMDIRTDVAFAGSLILDYDPPHRVQSCGVKYYPFFGVSKLVFKGMDRKQLDQAAVPHSSIDFQHGASLFVRLSALGEIGLMDERFFLYFEEQDWQFAGREKGFGNIVIPNSVVYHKGSVSTSSKKHLFFYYYNRSSVLFARKHLGALTRIWSTLMLILITVYRSKAYLKSIVWGIKGIAAGYTK